jgi:hypothetical protein
MNGRRFATIRCRRNLMGTNPATLGILFAEVS